MSVHYFYSRFLLLTTPHFNVIKVKRFTINYLIPLKIYLHTYHSFIFKQSSFSAHLSFNIKIVLSCLRRTFNNNFCVVMTNLLPYTPFSKRIHTLENILKTKPFFNAGQAIKFIWRSSQITERQLNSQFLVFCFSFYDKY